MFSDNGLFAFRGKHYLLIISLSYLFAHIILSSNHQLCPRHIFKPLKKLVNQNFDEFGIADYNVISKALNTDVVGNSPPFKDNIAVVRIFCERMSKLLQPVKQIIGHDIAKTV
jgi:hypothetical protein